MNKITSDVSMACYSCEKMALLAVGYKKLFFNAQACSGAVVLDNFCSTTSFPFKMNWELTVPLYRVKWPLLRNGFVIKY